MIDLGDGNGPSKLLCFSQPIAFRLILSIPENETAVIRYNYGDPALGTCQESIQGGNHFRYWVQNGPQRNSGAVFMAFSYERSLQGMCLNFTGMSLPTLVLFAVDRDVKCMLMTYRPLMRLILIREPPYCP